MKYFIFILFSGCLMAGAINVYGTRARLVDIETDDIEKIADHVCLHRPSYLKQISKISTISRLAKHLKHLSEDHSHFDCSQKYLTAIEDLRDFLNFEAKNVCSLKKISVAENLHHRLIVGKFQDKQHLPSMLRLFFYHYMYMMSSMCSSETYHELAHLKNLIFQEDELDDITSSLSMESSSLSYEDIYLFWNLVDRQSLKEHSDVRKYIDFENYTRVSIGVKNINRLIGLQIKCRSKFTPIYSKSLLSTIRLIDMGYYPKERKLLELLKKDRQARRFYELTKVCEALLPARIVELSTLDHSTIVLLNKDEVDHLSGPLDKSLGYMSLDQCKKCSVVGLDKLQSVFTDDAAEVAARIDNCVTNRSKATDKILRILYKRMKPGMFTSFLGKRKKEKKFLNSEMEESMYQLRETNQVDSLQNKLTNQDQEQVPTDKIKLMYFLSLVWWFFSSHY